TPPVTNDASGTVDSADDPGPSVKADAPPASLYDLHQSRPTHFEAFNVYVPYSNDYDQDGDSDETHPENPGFINVAAPNFSPFFDLTGSRGQASLIGPQGFGPQQYLPVGQPLPYTIQFANGKKAASAVGEARIVSQLDPNFDPRSFRLGDLQLGDLQVHIPGSVGSFQGDFDFTKSKGFILRVSAGIDINSNTLTWLLQAIDPNTGQVVQDPAVGL